MPADSLILFCRSAHEALIAAARVPRQSDLHRVFLFVGERPETADLAWIAQPDSMLVLDGLLDAHETPLEVGVRAGLMYAGGWDLLFCYAEQPPSDEDLAAARAALKEGGAVRMATVWGVTRDHVVLNGLDSAYRQAASATVGVAAELDIDDALRGVAKPWPIILAALREIAPLKSVGPFHGIRFADTAHQDKLGELVGLGQRLDLENLDTALLGLNSALQVRQAQASVVPGGVVIVLSPPGTETAWASKPYRTLNVDDGSIVSVFGQEL